MKVWQFLASDNVKNTSITLGLFVLLISLGWVSQFQPYTFLLYIFPIPLYFLLKRISIASAIGFGFNFGLYFGFVAQLWLARFEKFDPFILAIVIYAVVFMTIFAVSSLVMHKYKNNTFIQIFFFGWMVYLFQAFLHFFGPAKAFVKLTNAPGIYEWMLPFFGNGMIEGLTVATGFFFAIILEKFLRDKSIWDLKYYMLFFILVGVTFPLFWNSKMQNTNSENVKIHIIQANANYSWAQRVANVDEIFQYYMQETKVAANSGAKIVVWPEYAVPIDIVNKNRQYVEEITQASHDLDVVIVMGSIEDATPQESKNGEFIGYDLTLVFDPQKGMLVYRAVHPYSSNVLAGKKPIIFQTKYGNFPVLSCFEIAYHKFVADYFRKAKDVDFILALGNNQVFDGTYGYDRLKYHARTIAAENNRYLLYATNTGPTSIYDNRGKIIASIPYSQQGTVSYEVEKIRNKSIYSQYQEIVPFFLTGGLFFLIVGHARKRNKD